jgi:hypothetical protein
MRRVLLTVFAVLAISVVLPVAIASAYIYRVYFSNLDFVDSVLATLPQGEARPPADFTRVVFALDADSFESWVARSFVVDTCPDGAPVLEWHARNAIWGALLPRRLSQEQLVSLYAHYLQFEGGRGLTYGSQRYFSQDPESLTKRQIVELLVISRAPGFYSPTKNRDRLDQAVERAMTQLARPAA